MNMFVRPANEQDAENFGLWFSGMNSFRPDILRFPDTYTLCAFQPKRVVGFMVVQAGSNAQILYRFVSRPDSSDLEKAWASALLLSQVITYGFLNNIPEIYFMGDHEGTNNLSKRVFELVPPEEYKYVFEESSCPVYRLRLSDLEMK